MKKLSDAEIDAEIAKRKEHIRQRVRAAGGRLTIFEPTNRKRRFKLGNAVTIDEDANTIETRDVYVDLEKGIIEHMAYQAILHRPGILGLFVRVAEVARAPRP